MGTVTGTTQHRLDLVKTYTHFDSATQTQSDPYIVGINGVKVVNKDGNNIITSVEYNIEGIKYKTLLTEDVSLVGKPFGVTTPNLNRSTNITKSYYPSGISDGVREDVVYPTTFSYVTSGISETNYFVFTDDAKMGVVFAPKVYEEVFIERQSITVFESQARLSEILSLEGLEEYNNGFYNVTKTK